MRELDVEHSTERGMNRVLDRRMKTTSSNVFKGSESGGRGAMTGPLGRFDDRRMRALLERPDTEAGAKAREESAALGSKGMHSRGWRGPVRRKVELSKKASASDGVEASGVARRSVARGRGGRDGARRTGRDVLVGVWGETGDPQSGGGVASYSWREGTKASLPNFWQPKICAARRR